MAIVRIENAEMFVGLSLNDARSQIVGYGYEARLVYADGKTLVSSFRDYDPLRVNLYIENNLVVKVKIG